MELQTCFWSFICMYPELCTILVWGIDLITHLICCLKDSSGTRTKTWWNLSVGTPTPPSALGATPASPQRPSTSARWAARSHNDNVIMNEFRWLPVILPLKQHLTPQGIHQQARIGRAMRRYCNWYWSAGADDTRYLQTDDTRYLQTIRFLLFPGDCFAPGTAASEWCLQGDKTGWKHSLLHTGCPEKSDKHNFLWPK